MLARIRRLLAPPVFEGDADKTRAAWLLNVILLTLLARAVFIRITTGSDPPRLSFFVPFVLLLTAMMFVMRRGRVRLASVITVAGFWLSLSAAAVATGGLYSLGFRNYILPVIVAGLLLKRGAALLTAGLSIVAGLAMWTAGTSGTTGVAAQSASPQELLITHSISLVMAAVLVTLATGRIEEALAAARQEIAERQRAETDLRRSEERFSKAFELSPLRMGIVRIKDAVVVDVNARWVREMGFAREAVVGRSVLEMTDWIGDLGPWIRGLLDDGKPVRDLESSVTTKRGETRLAVLSAEPIEIGGEPCMLWVTSDITERRRAEQALRESEERFRTAFESATVGVCLVDVEGGFLSVNRTLCEMLGYSREELARMVFEQVTHEEDRHIGTAFVVRALAGYVSQTHFEKRYLHKDGHVIWAYVSSALVHQPVGNRRCFITYIQDITDRKRAEDEIRATSDQLRALMVSLRSAKEEEGVRIAREIHDELGSTLTGLRWDLEELDRAASGTKGPLDAAALREKTARMFSLIDAAIDVVRRISSELRPSILDDLGLAAAVEWQAQQFQKRTGILCHYGFSAEHLDLGAEQSTAVFRIFQEALTNVLRHAQATMIDVSLEEDRDEFILKIRDNGKGIRDEDTSGQFSLGLLGMRERAQLIGGRVEISGTESKGTTVTLRIPRRPAARAATGGSLSERTP